MTRALNDAGFTAFGEKQADALPRTPASPGEADAWRVHPTLYGFAPAPTQPEPGASAFQLGLTAAAYFVLIFCAVMAIWAVFLTGGVSAADFGAIGREILSAIQFKLAHLSPPSPTLPPTA